MHFLFYLMGKVANIDSSVCWIVFRSLLIDILLASIYETNKTEENSCQNPDIPSQF